MSTDKRPEMQISERELTAMTRDLDELHESTFPGVRTLLDEFSANLAHITRGHPTGRRGFLLGVGGVTTLGMAAACSSNDTGSSTTAAPAAPASTTAAATYEGDLKVVALAAALENLAVTAYTGALDAAGKGTLGTVPPAIGVFVQTAMKQHQDHAAAWNAVLSKAGKPTISDAPLSITADQVKALGAAKSVPDVAKLALDLENAAAQTYTFAAANVTDTGGIMTAATIQPVEAMHAAILNFVLGQYPVPDAFIGVDKAVKPDALLPK
ncbi:ferritin-like domain-containing protein [Actinokineospora diospyrosa]|uniref:Ferritin-like domain-containing protein n=1 Tax=Actinokineospora diospyrosa TaxID=103728 RepID=A0ABT1IEK6_9PSEU|nr:ferritin-like domain-containing protein [Actinokineospora diospyrosa]MCP2271072.1 Ferritin-like domain-containing protein [Actinokineospora diospyrosa]